MHRRTMEAAEETARVVDRVFKRGRRREECELHLGGDGLFLFRREEKTAPRLLEGTREDMVVRRETSRKKRKRRRR